MDQLIKQLTSEPLSGQEMMRATDNETTVVTYEDLRNVDNIFDLLGPNNNFTLLYETEPDYGHWTAVLYHPETNTLEFFDPYGKPIDSQLQYIKDPNISKDPLLSVLMLDTDAKIIYNDEPLQKFGKDISSCGRHVAMRINLRWMPLEQYQDIMMSKSKDERDKMVTYLTAFI